MSLPYDYQTALAGTPGSWGGASASVADGVLSVALHHTNGAGNGGGGVLTPAVQTGGAAHPVALAALGLLGSGRAQLELILRDAVTGYAVSAIVTVANDGTTDVERHWRTPADARQGAALVSAGSVAPSQFRSWFDDAGWHLQYLDAQGTWRAGDALVDAPYALAALGATNGGPNFDPAANGYTLSAYAANNGYADQTVTVQLNGLTSSALAPAPPSPPLPPPPAAPPGPTGVTLGAGTAATLHNGETLDLAPSVQPAGASQDVDYAVAPDQGSGAGALAGNVYTPPAQSPADQRVTITARPRGQAAADPHAQVVITVPALAAAPGGPVVPPPAAAPGTPVTGELVLECTDRRGVPLPGLEFPVDSLDPSVCTVPDTVVVGDDGLARIPVTAVGRGTTTVEVTCGDVVLEGAVNVT